MHTYTCTNIVKWFQVKHICFCRQKLLINFGTYAPASVYKQTYTYIHLYAYTYVYVCKIFWFRTFEILYQDLLCCKWAVGKIMKCMKILRIDLFGLVYPKFHITKLWWIFKVSAWMVERQRAGRQIQWNESFSNKHTHAHCWCMYVCMYLSFVFGGNTSGKISLCTPHLIVFTHRIKCIEQVANYAHVKCWKSDFLNNTYRHLYINNHRFWFTVSKYWLNLQQWSLLLLIIIINSLVIV